MISLKNVVVIFNMVLKESKRKKDFYVLFILLILLVTVLSFIRWYELQTTVRYVKEFALLLVWFYSIFVSIVFSARQIPREIEKKTIMPLFAKPILKIEFILGKFLGVLFSMAISLFCFYFLLFVFVQTSQEPFYISTFFQAYICHVFFCSILIAMAMAGSILMTQAANITICFIIVPVILVFSEHLKIISLTMSKIQQNIMLVLYYCIPHLEFYDLRTLLVHSCDSIKILYMFIFAGYTLLWVALFLGVTYVKKWELGGSGQ